jgi:hypothetical protein
MGRRIATSLAIALLLTNTASVQASPKPTPPKVGNCYLYSQDEVQSLNSRKAAVNCKNSHNVETYRVIASHFKRDPNLEPPISIYVKISPICEAGITNSKFFTGWAAKVPTRSEWKSGARWLRCEAFVLQTESETAIFKSWQGKKLDIK